MDDRIAKALLENNILVRQKNDEGRISLLEKLATNKSVDLQTLPVPGVVPGVTWQSVFIDEDFASGGLQVLGGFFVTQIGALGWQLCQTCALDVSPVISISPDEHPGVYKLYSAAPYGYLFLQNLPSVNAVNSLQFVALFEPTVTVNDGYAFGMMKAITDSAGFTIDGTGEGVYFRRADGDTNWFAVTTFGGSTTSYDTGFVFNVNKWCFFEIRRKTLNIFEFYINQILVGTHQADLTDRVAPVLGHIDNSNSFATYWDYFGMQLASITQRWD